jgi:hypothetical protein
MFIPPTLESSIPGYGKYGGPGRSGERENPDGSIYIDPDTKNLFHSGKPLKMILMHALGDMMRHINLKTP